MRTLIAAVVAGVLLAPLAAAARPGSPSALTMKVSSNGARAVAYDALSLIGLDGGQHRNDIAAAAAGAQEVRA